jgi:hypothetical protein
MISIPPATPKLTNVHVISHGHKLCDKIIVAKGTSANRKGEKNNPRRHKVVGIKVFDSHMVKYSFALIFPQFYCVDSSDEVQSFRYETSLSLSASFNFQPKFSN